METKAFDFYIDESGNFENDDEVDSRGPKATSLVGGLLIDHAVFSDQLALELLPNPVHCRDKYNAYYLTAIETLHDVYNAKLVVFENQERLRIVNGDITYLNIISEGLVKLFRDLATEYPGVTVNVYIATRKAMAAVSGIINSKEYESRLEEKVYVALRRNSIPQCNYNIFFEDARYYKKLDFADIICYTWYRKDYIRANGKRKFSNLMRSVIARIYEDKWIYSVFEDAKTLNIKQLLLDRNIGEAIAQLCSVDKIERFAELKDTIVQLFCQEEEYAQETWLNQISLIIRHYNRQRRFEEALYFIENYKKYFLQPAMDHLFKMQAFRSIKLLNYWIFDTDFYLLTIYDHLGNVQKADDCMHACRQNINCVYNSWEHIDYYFKYCIREANCLINKYAFNEVIEKTNGLIKILTEAKSLFEIIGEYNNSNEQLRSDLLGRVLGVRIEANINLFKERPDLFKETISYSDAAFKEFTKERDLCRQYQWRCLINVEIGKVEDAYISLLKAAECGSIDDCAKSILEPKVEEYMLLRYTDVLLKFKEIGDSRGDQMAEKLRTSQQWNNMVLDKGKNNFPWNISLWNVAKYIRLDGDYAGYKGYYRKAMEISKSNQENVTMLTYCISMSADRLLWCREHEMDESAKAKLDFIEVVNKIKKAKMTNEMLKWFRIEEIKDGKLVSNDLLKYLSGAYLK